MRSKLTVACITLLASISTDGGVPSRYAEQTAQWFLSEEGRRIADNVLTWQSPHGSWPKNLDTASEPYRGDKEKLEGTFDNGATIGELRFLASAFGATKDPRYRQAFLKGLDHILEAQYPNGGWPQFYPLSPDYPRHITFNDGAMIGLMTFLGDVAGGEPPWQFVDRELRDRAEAAIARGIDCILKTQIRQNGKVAVWCAQHDEKSLGPAWARAYEPPSLSGSESIGIVRFLMSVKKPTPEIIAAVEGAVEWLKSVVIHGMRVEEFTDAQGRDERRIVADPAAGPLWARFYELGSNRPIFLDRDSVVRYSLAEIGQERRGGYAWYGNWADNLLAKEYPEWRSKHNLDALSVVDPRCEGLREAPQVNTHAPRFSWRLHAKGRDVRQKAYQLRVTEVDGRDRPLGAPVESARVESDETQWVVVPGFVAGPRKTYAWQVRIWDNRGYASDWTEPRRFGTGLLGDRWPADWIGDGRTVPLFETALPVTSAVFSSWNARPCVRGST